MNPGRRSSILPSSAYKREQAAISRGRLYPVTAFYTFYSVLMLALATRTAHPRAGLAFYLAGIPVWTLVEYLSHRCILHRPFQKPKHRCKIHNTLPKKVLERTHGRDHE